MSWTTSFQRPPAVAPSELAAIMGGKGANLAIMAAELGLPVPPGFTIVTAACGAYLASGWPDGLDDELRERMSELEAAVGRGYGDPADPLLVSVRSGAPVSMPGMLDTILDVGLDEATSAGLASVSGDPAFAAACRERLQTMYRDIVGTDVPDDPWAQLRGAVEAVFRSWHSDRARSYRQREGIPEDLGTAVVVQAMVFGNRGHDSATGVLFTRDPATGTAAPYGDVLFGAQGEDVVAGTHATEPVGILDERLPAVAAELRRHAAALERHFRDACDIEFTIEEGRLWLLQNRIAKRTPQAALRMALDMAEDPSFPLSREEAVRRVADILADPPSVLAERPDGVPVVTRGLGASPGVACGAIATTPEAAVAMAEAGTSVILVRRETSPDDVHGMARAAGILTATGGLASHAAVVARGWSIPAVVGAAGVRVEGESVTIDGQVFGAGQVISIDGGTGEVFGGEVRCETIVVPEAATLLAWAAQAGIPIGEGRPGTAGGEEVEPVAGDGRATADVVVRALLIKGYVTPELLAPAIGASAEEAAEQLDRLAADGVVEMSGGMSRLTADGRAMAQELLAADRQRWGTDRAAAALDAFLALDGRMKTIVTAWQMREVDGQAVLNDHADAAYDALVLRDLEALHADAAAWLAPLTDGLPRLASYAERLARAAASAVAGDGRYIASPRVDSYHGAWFELHEDLIQLAGRTRAEEVAAGRA